MPRYFFNVHAPEREETDLVGHSCRDDVAALLHAMEVASGVVRTRLDRLDCTLGGEIVIEDERQRLVATLPVRAAAY